MMHAASGRVCSEHMLRSLLVFWRRFVGQSISHEAVCPQGPVEYPNDLVAVHTLRC